MPTTRKQPLLSLQPNQLHTTSSRILITLLSCISILLHLPQLRKPNNSSLLETLILFHNENSTLTHYASIRIPIRYNITKQPHSRTQQFIPQTTSLIACTLMNSKQTISAFHFRSLCSVTINNELVESMYKIDPFFITPIRLQFPSFLHSLHSSLFYAMNVHYPHMNEIICPSHSTIE